MDAREQARAVTGDPWLRVLMKIGIPMAIVSVIALWTGQLLGLPVLFHLFVVTAGIALVTGLAYNVRFVLLSLRRARAEGDGDG